MSDAEARGRASERTLSGVVEDSDGRPVAGAELTLVGSADAARSGSDGRFSLRSPAGTGVGHLSIREGGREWLVEVDALEGERLRVVAGPPDTVPMRVLTPGSAPVPTRFGWLALSRRDSGLVAGPSGEARAPRFAVRGLPAGTHALMVWAGPFLPTVVEPVRLDGRVTHPLVTVELMRRGASVAGRVLGPGNAPQVQATVSARPEDASVRLPPGRATCVTDAGGRYRIEGIPAGRYTLAVESGVRAPTEMTLNLLAREERALDLEG